jgi:predicted TIM-barrel fold metal-dependent hydrolase
LLRQLPPAQREKILGQNARDVLRHARSG